MGAIVDWFTKVSGWKIFLVTLCAILFADMLFYYIAAFLGKPTPPYPILYEVFSLLKEINISPGV